jgi:protein Mpv17
VKTAINVVIYIIGDWMSQVGWGRTKNLLDFDLARTARNGLIGAMFGPLVHYYYDFSDWILPMDVPINRLYKLLMDQSIYFFVKCSAYIALVGLLRGDPPKEVVQDVKERIWPVVFRGWRFWPLAHIVTYGFIPPRHRVLWVNMLDLLWSSILAQLASKEGGEEIAAAAAPAAAAVDTSGAAPTVLEANKGFTPASSSSPSPIAIPTAPVMASSAEEKRAEEEDTAGRAAVAAAAAVPAAGGGFMPSLLPVTAEELPAGPALGLLRAVDGEVGEGKSEDLLAPLGRKEGDTSSSTLDKELA